MKTENIILFLFTVVLAVSSCKESEESTPMSPTTEEILAGGLNIGPDGTDTTVVFPKTSNYSIGVKYTSGVSKWCAVSESTETDANQSVVRITCTPSDTSLFAREAMVTLSSSDDNYVIKVAQSPYKLAFFNDSICYVDNAGGEFTVSVRANTSFDIDKGHYIYVIDSAGNTRQVNTSWVNIKGQYGKQNCNSGNIFQFPFTAQLNTGLGRRAFFVVSGDSLHNDYSEIEVRQEPCTLNRHEDLDFSTSPHERAEVWLGKNEQNLSRLECLTTKGFLVPNDLRYFAKIGKLNLDSLDMSESTCGGINYDCDITNRMFFGSHLVKILLPNGVKAIYDEAFANCANLKMVTLSSSVERIGARAFATSPNIGDVVIPTDSKLTYIGDEAFNTGGTLTSLYVPQSTNLSEDAFKGLRVKELHMAISTPPVQNSDNDVDRSNCVLYVPKGSKDKYSTATYWKDFGKIVEE